MSYFNQTLGGNIPLNVLDSIDGFQNTYRLHEKFGHLQVNEHFTSEDSYAPIDIKNILESSYGASVQASVGLDRNKIMNGVKKLIDEAVTFAFTNNKSDIIKVGDMTDDNSVKEVVNKVASDLSKSFTDNISKLASSSKFDASTKDTLMDVIHVTGMTNKTAKEIEDIQKKMALGLELHYNFKSDMMINMNSNLKNIISPKNIKNCGNVTMECVFGNRYIDMLSGDFVEVLENVLGNMMNVVKYDRVCSFYAFSINLSDLLASAVKKSVENFYAIDAGNTTNTSDSKVRKSLDELEKKTDQSKVIKGMASMLTKAITNAASKNQADLLKTIAASNQITVGNASSSGGGFVMKGVNQKNVVDTKSESDFVQKITTKVTSDITNSVKDQINTSIKQTLENTSISEEKSNIGSTIGGTVGDLAKAVGSTISDLGKSAAGILSISAGNSTSTSTSDTDEKELKKKFSLDQSFKQEKKNEASTDIANAISSENLAKAAADSKAANAIDIGKISVKGDIVLSEITQENIVTDVMKNVFNQTVVTEIATKVVNEFDSMITNMVENVDKTLTKTQQEKVVGDIQAAGAAAKAALQGVGEAAQGVGKGVSSAAEGVGTGLASTAVGLGAGMETAGKGIASAAVGVGTGGAALIKAGGDAASGMMWPIIIGGCVIAVIIGIIMYMTISKHGDKALNMVGKKFGVDGSSAPAPLIKPSIPPATSAAAALKYFKY